MSYFLCEQNLHLNEAVTITGNEARHMMLSRRLKAGEHVLIQGPDEQRFECEVTALMKNEVTVMPLAQAPVPPEPPVSISLFQALVSEQTLNVILQKSAELGAAHIIVFPSEHSPARPKENLDRKLERWNRILKEAAKQSNRVHPPKLEYAPDFDAAAALLRKHDLIVLTDTVSAPSLGSSMETNTPNSVACCIGPEGGWSETERQALAAMARAVTASLGPRTLRAETAALAALAILQARFGDMA